MASSEWFLPYSPRAIRQVNNGGHVKLWKRASGLWRQIFGARSAAQADDLEWVIVNFKMTGGGPYGSHEEREMVHRFSSQLDALLQEHGVGAVDGDEFGNGTGALFMVGSDANKIFDVIRPMLTDWEPLKGGHVTKSLRGPTRRERIQF